MAYKNKEARAAYAKKHYAENKEQYIERAAEHKKKAIQRNREYVWNVLQESTCAHCGESDPVVLQFDHVDRENKSFAIANGIHRGRGLQSIQEEIDKCQILCANCHARKTACDLAWYRCDTFLDTN